MASMFVAVAVIAVAYWFFRSPLCCSLAGVVRARGVLETRWELATVWRRWWIA